MSTTHRSPGLFVGSAIVFAFMLLGPMTVKADEEGAVPAPVAVPSVDETNAEAARAAAQVLAAQQALRSHNLGSLQEEHLRAIVAAAPPEDATSGDGSVEARRVDETPSADDLPAALASGTRSETTHLATIVLPD